MDYDKEILRILTEAGMNGLTVAKVSRHVYNTFNSFFNAVSYDDVHRHVAQYLIRNSKNSESIVEKVGRGTYRLNMKSQETRQLMLQFTDEVEVTENSDKPEDLSLSLF